MKIYTRKGDGGETGLLGGVRVGKDHPRVEAYGAVDETNAHIGQAVASLSGGLSPAASALRGMLVRIQHELFDLGADLAVPSPGGDEATGAKAKGKKKKAKGKNGGGKGSRRAARAVTTAELRIDEEQVEALERDVDLLEQRMEPLRTFILPSGGITAAALHTARTVCRRAERRLVALAHLEPVAPIHLRYLNRLSDFLFVAARSANRVAGVADVKVTFGRKA
jgi:cob(I)alamin adenosyltransferase